MLEAMMDVMVDTYDKACDTYDTAKTAIVREYKEVTGAKTIIDFRLDRDNTIVMMTADKKKLKTENASMTEYLNTIHAVAGDDNPLPISDRFGEFERALEGLDGMEVEIHDIKALIDSNTNEVCRIVKLETKILSNHEVVEDVWAYSIATMTAYDTAATVSLIGVAVMATNPATVGAALVAVAWTSSDYTSDFTYDAFYRVFEDVRG